MHCGRRVLRSWRMSNNLITTHWLITANPCMASLAGKLQPKNEHYSVWMAESWGNTVCEWLSHEAIQCVNGWVMRQYSVWMAESWGNTVCAWLSVMRQYSVSMAESWGNTVRAWQSHKATFLQTFIIQTLNNKKNRKKHRQYFQEIYSHYNRICNWICGVYLTALNSKKCCAASEWHQRMGTTSHNLYKEDK